MTDPTKLEHMTAAEMMDLIRNTYAEFETALNAIPADLMVEKFMGDWTPKDIVAHVTWSEREMVQVLKTHILAGSDLWLKSQDERNEAIFKENEDKTLAEVMKDHLEVHRELVALLEMLTTEDINNPNFIAEVPPNVTPWRLLMGNTWKHYSEHAADLREAIEPPAA
jgi:lysyl-tRNA synthetase class II